MATHHDRNRITASKRSQVLESNSRTDFNNSNDQSDYEIVVQFELRREREKTRILQERLHNKQVFIQQMKEYQDQLTLAFEKCQEQLIATKKTLQKFCIAQRNYEEQIADLKHLVIRLEEEINLRQKDLNQRHYSSVNKEQVTSPFKKREVRSKTLMNHEEDSPKGFRDTLEQQLVKESKKITKFIRQFLMMTGCFCTLQSNDALKNKLKIAWKWVKEVVKEWNDLTNEKQFWDNFLSKANERGKFSRQGNPQQILNKILVFLQSK